MSKAIQVIITDEETYLKVEIYPNFVDRSNKPITLKMPRDSEDTVWVSTHCVDTSHVVAYKDK